MKASDLIKILEKHPDFEVQLTVHEFLKEMQCDIYPYPYENHKVDLHLDDIGYSDGVFCFGCNIK